MPKYTYDLFPNSDLSFCIAAVLFLYLGMFTIFCCAWYYWPAAIVWFGSAWVSWKVFKMK